MNRIYSGPGVTQRTCTSMCAFDHDTIDGTYDYGCHFTVLDGTNCYLGSMGYQGNLLSSLPSQNLHLKSCKGAKEK